MWVTILFLFFNIIKNENCSRNEYLINEVCKKCPPNCQTCKLSNKNFNQYLGNIECKSCLESYYLLLGFCYQTCPFGYFRDQGICKKCIDNCIDCSSFTTCTQCQGKFFLNNGSCNTNDCGLGLFKDSVTNRCQKCPASCKECTSSIDCSLCKEHFLRQANLCVTNCSLNFYLDGDKCPSCHKNCLMCKEREDKCQKCVQGYFLFEIEDECVAKCRDKFYGNKLSGKCEKCFEKENCTRCSGPLASQCYPCKEEQYALYTANAETQCHLNCPDGYYDQKENKSCQKCDYLCTKCFNNNSQSCTSCINNAKLINDTECELCKSDQFSNDDQSECLQCFPNCATCFGEGENQCSSCNQTYYLLKNQNKCTNIATDGYFINKNYQTIDKCLSQCGTCEKFSSNCIQCKGSRINPPLCICGGNTYEDSNKECQLCSIMCQTCLNEPNYCLTCPLNMVLKSIKHTCECDDGFFYKQEQQKCNQCLFSCLKCTSEKICKECRGNRIINKFKFCQCPYGYKDDGNSNICFKQNCKELNSCPDGSD